jgi:nicotinic acid mononucleotide adenylyltransferase
MWQEKLKELNVSIHVIATGAGAGLQKELWATCGSSAYLSGASFPYATEEQEELLGFLPIKFCSKEAAIDLASAAYMKAFRFGGKSPIGVGITASVATSEEHRGEHCFYTAIITDTLAVVSHTPLAKGKGTEKRYEDGAKVDFDSLFTLLSCLGLTGTPANQYKDATSLARERFFERPFFAADGTRHKKIDDTKQYGLLSGSFNPPHEGHFGMANAFINDEDEFFHTGRRKVLFETAANPPHKDALTVQDLLKRAKLLKGKDRIFTNIPLFIDKVKAFPGMPIIVGSDTLDRMLDPKWGVNIEDLLYELQRSGDIFVVSRIVDGNLLTVNNVMSKYEHILPIEIVPALNECVHGLPGRWDISSTEIRNGTIH